MSCSRVRSITSRMLARGDTVMGSTMTPLSNFLTVRTCIACSSAAMFLWMIPMPPACAIPIASRDSVTVSMAEETKGMFRSIFPGESRRDFGVAGEHLGVAGNQEDIVERQRVPHIEHRTRAPRSAKG